MSRVAMSSSSSDLSSSSSNQRAPLLRGNYQEWRPLIEAFLMKNGVENIHHIEIPQFKELSEESLKWDKDEVASYASIVLAKPKSARAGSPSRAPSTSTSSADKKADSSDVQEEARKKVKSLLSRSHKAYGIIFEVMPADLQAQAASVPNGYAYGLWEFLEKKFQNTELDNISDLYAQWSSLCMADGESFDSYKARVDRVANLLEKAKDRPSSGQYMHRIIDFLHSDYRVVTSAIRCAGKLRDHAAIDWIEIVSTINAFERQNNKSSGGDSGGVGQSPATVAAATRQGGYRGQQRNPPPNSSINSPVCHHCGKTGHIQVNCRKFLQAKLNSLGKEKTAPSQKANGTGCGKCGAAKHTSDECIEGKIPGWRKEKLIKEGKLKPVAGAVSVSFADGNKFDALSQQEEEQEDDANAGAFSKSYHRASCAVVCAGVDGMRETVQRVKSILKRVAVTQGKTQHLAPKSTQSKLSNLEISNDDYGVDTMASVAICGDQKKFVGPLQACKPVPVKLGDGSVTMCKQRGTVVVESMAYSPSGEAKMWKYHIHNVLYHPSFPINLLSWCALKKLKWELHSTDKTSYLLTPSKLRVYLEEISDVLIWKKHNAPPSAKLVCALPTSLTPKWTEPSDLVLLHQRLGHVGFDAMIKMINIGKSEGLGEIAMSTEKLKLAREKVMECPSCLQGKGHRTAFGQRGLMKGTQVCEVAHLDSYSHTINGFDGRKHHEYGCTITDAYADHMDSVVATHKDQLTMGVIETLEHNQTQSGKKYKRIFCDGGGEFINESIRPWCKSRGVELHFPPKETPQLNGVSERHVRTHKEGTRTLMRQAGLPDRFWRHAVAHFVVVWNRSHISPDTGMTPYEAMYGKKPSVQHFGVFGCNAFFYVSKNDRTSLMPKKEPCVYLGHDPLRSCSIVYRLRDRDIIRTRDLTLHQNKFTFAYAVANGGVQAIINAPAGSLVDDIGDEKAEKKITIASQPQGGLASVPEESEESEENMSEKSLPADDDSNFGVEERKALEDALAMMVTEAIARATAKMTSASSTTASTVQTSNATEFAIAAAASTGIHQLESQTPKTFKEALLSSRRRE
jgi:hypothetical protein